MKVLSTPRMERCIGCHSCSLACARLIHKRLSWDTAGIRIGSSGGLSTGFEGRTCLACTQAPCAAACPTGAYSQRRGGGVIVRKNICIRCGECYQACPNNVLQPLGLSRGLDNLWTPQVVADWSGCEPSCSNCGQVCPTGAIWEFTLKQKAWERRQSDEKPIRIGTAFYDHGRCLPWSMATECIVCEEWCPTTPKAIYLRPVEVTGADGKAKTVRQPYVDAARCEPLQKSSLRNGTRV